MSLLLTQLEPHYPQSGRQPTALNRMLPIYCMRQSLGYSDRQVEDALYEINSIRRLAGFGRVTERCQTKPQYAIFVTGWKNAS